MRQALAVYPTLHPKLWLDEWNVNAGFDPRMDGTYGAAFMAAVLSTAQYDGLDRSDYYDAMDDSPIDDFGLLTQSGVPKPDYWTFDFWYGLSGPVLPATLTPALTTAPGKDEIGAVATRSGGGTVQVLIYDFAPTGPVGRPGQRFSSDLTRQVALTISALPRARYSASLRVIDTGHSGSPQPIGTLAGPEAAVPLTPSGQSVTLVTVSPGRS